VFCAVGFACSGLFLFFDCFFFSAFSAFFCLASSASFSASWRRRRKPFCSKFSHYEKIKMTRGNMLCHYWQMTGIISHLKTAPVILKGSFLKDPKQGLLNRKLEVIAVIASNYEIIVTLTNDCTNHPHSCILQTCKCIAIKKTYKAFTYYNNTSVGR